MKRLLYLLLPALLLGCSRPTFNNPLDVKFGDPFVLRASDGRFYMYGTSDGINGFRACPTTL